VDDDRDVADIVQTILIDEGFRVSCLYQPTKNDVKAAIERIEPDVVLLDGGTPAAYGPSWDLAAWLSTRSRPIPAVMLTGHVEDREEAILDQSERAKRAHMAAVIAKPFDIDRLVTAVRNAVGQSTTPLTDREEADNLARMLEKLRAAGAYELTGSSIGRVWATFRAGEDRSLYKIYRWRAAGVYFVGRYDLTGNRLQPLGEFDNLDALIVYCLGKVAGSRLS
jgi:FixJ family two-component response regulator